MGSRLTVLDPAINSLLAATSSLVSTPELSEVLGKILRIAEELLQADAYAVWRCSPEDSSWHILYARGISEEFALQPVGATPRGFRMPGPMVVADVQNFTTVDHRRELYAKEGIQSFIAYPLETSQGTVGTVTFYYRRKQQFVAEAVQTGQLLSNIANAAINAAELFEAQKSLRREAQDSAERAEFLANASSLLASSLDYSATLNRVAQLAVPKLADWCSVSVIEAEGKLERIAVAHADPGKVALAQEYNRKFPPNLNEPRGVGEVIRSRKSQLVPQVSDEMLQLVAKNEEHLRAIRELGLRSVLVVPLVVRETALGALTLVMSDSQRTLGRADLELAEALAVRAAVAIDNARLYHAMSRASDEARLRQEELRLVQAAANVASWTYDPETQVFSFLSDDASRLLGLEQPVSSLSLEQFSSRLFFSTDRHKFTEAFSRLEQGRKTLEVEIRVGTKRGSVNLLSMRGKLFFNLGQMKVLGVLIELPGNRAESTHRAKRKVAKNQT